MFRRREQLSLNKNNSMQMKDSTGEGFDRNRKVTYEKCLTFENIVAIIILLLERPGYFCAHL